MTCVTAETLERLERTAAVLRAGGDDEELAEAVDEALRALRS